MPTATDIPAQEAQTPKVKTPKQEQDLTNLKTVQYIIARKKTDSDLKHVLLGLPKTPEGKYTNYFGISFRDIFRTLGDTFDPAFRQSQKTSYTKDELKEFLEHFESVTPGFETHLDNAIHALERGEETQTIIKKESEPREKEKEKEREKEKKEGQEAQEAKEIPEPIEEEEGPKAEIIENSQQTGPTRMQKIRDLGAKVPLSKTSGKLLSPILRRINPFLEKNKEILIPAIAGVALGAAIGGAPTAVLYGLFGGAMGAGVIKPIVQGGGGREAPEAETPVASPAAPSGTSAAPSPQREETPFGPPPPQPSQPTNSEQNNPVEQVAGLAMSFPGKRTWIIVGILIVSFVILITMSSSSSPSTTGTGGTPQTSTAQPNTSTVTVSKKQENCKSEKNYCVVSNGDQIQYTLTVTNTAASPADIELTDTPSTSVNCINASDNPTGCTSSTNTISWTLNQLPPNQPKSLSLTLQAPNDTWLVNKAQATTASSGGSGGGSSDFNALIKNQGRNTTILGANADEFANNVVSHTKGTFLSKLANYPEQLRQIYSSSVASNVNPLTVLAIWGVEAGFDTNNTEFGCKPFGSGFTDQLNCSINTLNYWMNYFDQHNQNGVLQLTPNCSYSDSFSYAYEKYTPVCAINDSNDNARSNFVKFYNKILGG